MKKMTLVGAGFLFIVLLIAGCAQTEQTVQQPETKTAQAPSAITVKEFKVDITHSGGFEPNEFAVKKGDTVRFILTSYPVTHRHGIGIDGYSIDEEITASPADGPQAVEFVADNAGTFDIDCGTSCALGPLGEHGWHKAVLVVEE